MFTLGIVSNCWRTQLNAGVALVELIAEAHQRGFRAVELRQTCLGEFEAGEEPLPLAEALSALPDQFPGMRFNVAVNVPFLTPGLSAHDPVFDAAKWAAQAVAGEYPPHLRLVDLQTTAAQLSETTPEAVGGTIAQLVRSLVELDGVLSLEHARQPWRGFREAFDAARKNLVRDADRLRLCYDPCNLLASGDVVDPAAITATLKADEVSMVHAKQRRENRALSEVADGEIDWPAQAAALRQIRYRGPLLFEIEPHEQIWERLASSCRYLCDAGFDIRSDAIHSG